MRKKYERKFKKPSSYVCNGFYQTFFSVLAIFLAISNLKQDS